MPSLLLLRHAKSAWPPGLEDRQRPLARRGERACQTIGRFLRANNLLPDRVVASPAVRAAETARLVLRAAGSLVPVTLDERVYDDEVLEVVADLVGTGGGHVMIVGHEPGIMGAVTALSGAVVAVPTAALVVVDLPGSDDEAAVLRLVIPPRMLEAWSAESQP